MTSSALNAVNEYLMLKALVENAAAQAKRRGGGAQSGMKEEAVVTGTRQETRAGLQRMST